MTNTRLTIAFAVLLVCCVVNSVVVCQVRDTVFNPKKRNHLESVFFLPNDSALIGACYCGGSAGHALISWSLIDGKSDTMLSLDRRTRIRRIAMSHDGNLVVIATRGDDPHFLGCYSLRERIWKWKINDAELVRALTFSEDDKEIAAVWSEWIYRIDSQTGKRLERYKGILDDFPLGGNKITLGRFSPSGRYYIIWQEHPSPWGLADLGVPPAREEIGVWDLKDRRIIAHIPKPEAIVLSAAFTADEKQLIVSCDDKKIWLFPLTQNKPIGNCEGRANYLAISGGGRLLACIAWDATIWEYPALTEVKDLGTFTNKMTPSEEMPAAFSHGGKWLAVEQLGTLNVYDTGSWNLLWSIQTCP